MENGIVEGNIVSTADGNLTALSFDPATGVLTYEYTLTSASGEHSAQGADAIAHIFKVSVRDADDTEQHGFISVKVVDDTPNAVDDMAFADEGRTEPVIGNVLNNDVFGADGRNADVFVRFLDPENARYGSIVFGEDGSYNYTLDNSLAEVKALTVGETLQDTFRYEIRDADGDVHEATLTITIRGVDNGITVTPENPVDPDPDIPGKGPDDLEPGAKVSEVTVSEELLGGEAPVAANGAFTVFAPDGVREIVISGVSVWTAENGIVEGHEIRTADGVLVATGFNPATGRLTYEYTLENPSHEHSAQGADVISHTFKVSVKDADDTEVDGFISVKVVDAMPNAVDDTAFADEGRTESVIGNVLNNDVFGADGRNADVFVRFLDPENARYGSIVFGEDGSYNYTLDNSLAEVKALTVGETLQDTFRYEIRDADGDVHEATLTITIRGVDNGITVTPENPVDPDPDIPGKGPDELDSGIQVSEVTVNEQMLGGEASVSGRDAVMISAPDGVREIAVSGKTVWTAENGMASDTAISTADGTLTVTGFDAGSGRLSYEYVLERASGEHSAQGADSIGHHFRVSITDMDGSENHGFIAVTVVDDVPSAELVMGGETTGQTWLEGRIEAEPGNDSWDAEKPFSIGDQSPDSVDLENGVVTFHLSARDNMPDGTLVLTRNAEDSSKWDYRYEPESNATFNTQLSLSVNDSDGDSADVTISFGQSYTPRLGDSDGNEGDGLELLQIIVDEGDHPDLSGSHEGHGPSGQVSFVVNLHGDPGTLDIAGLPVKLERDGSYEIDGENISQTLNGVSLTLVNAVYSAETEKWTITCDYSYNGERQDHLGPENVELARDFVVTLTNGKGEAATGTLSLVIHDDAPDAVNDAESIDEGAESVNGNVLSNDSFGADRPENETVEWKEAQGRYGEITLNSDGTWEYRLDNSNPLVRQLTDVGDGQDILGQTYLEEKFTYSVTDRDGDTREAVLTIRIDGVDNGIVITPSDSSLDHSSLTVKEEELGGDTLPEASDFLRVEAADGLSSIEIAGVIVWTREDGLTGNTVPTDEGRLTVIGFADGLLEYRYVLERPTDEHTGEGRDSMSHTLAVKITDTDGTEQQSSIILNVVDDMPEITSVTQTATTHEDGSVWQYNDTVPGETLSGSVALSTGQDVQREVPLSVKTNSGFSPFTRVTSNRFLYDDGNGLLIFEKTDAGYSYTYTPDVGNLNFSREFTLAFSDADDNAEFTIRVGRYQEPTVENAVPNPSGWTSAIAPESGSLVLDEAVFGGGEGVSEHGASGTSGFLVNLHGGSGTLVLSAGSVSFTIGIENGQVASLNKTPISNLSLVSLTNNGVTFSGFSLTDNGDGSYFLNYAYALTQATGHESDSETFAGVLSLQVSDSHNSASTTVDVTIFDSEPAPVDDKAVLAEDAVDPAGGNVLDNDVFGADGRHPASAFIWNGLVDAEGNLVVPDAGGTIQGEYGVFTLNANGTWTYVLDTNDIRVKALSGPAYNDDGSVASPAETLTETVRYTVTDADGDTREAHLTVTIEGKGNDNFTILDEVHKIDEGNTPYLAPGEGFTDHVGHSPSGTGYFVALIADGTIRIGDIAIDVKNGMASFDSNAVTTVNGISVSIANISTNEDDALVIEYAYSYDTELDGRTHQNGAPVENALRVAVENAEGKRIFSDNINFEIHDDVSEILVGEVNVIKGSSIISEIDFKVAGQATPISTKAAFTNAGWTSPSSMSDSSYVHVAYKDNVMFIPTTNVIIYAEDGVTIDSVLDNYGNELASKKDNKNLNISSKGLGMSQGTGYGGTAISSSSNKEYSESLSIELQNGIIRYGIDMSFTDFGETDRILLNFYLTPKNNDDNIITFRQIITYDMLENGHAKVDVPAGFTKLQATAISATDGGQSSFYISSMAFTKNALTYSGQVEVAEGADGIEDFSWNVSGVAALLDGREVTITDCIGEGKYKLAVEYRGDTMIARIKDTRGNANSLDGDRLFALTIGEDGSWEFMQYYQFDTSAFHTIEIPFTVKDTDGSTDSKNLVINLETGDVSINSYTNIILGYYNTHGVWNASLNHDFVADVLEGRSGNDLIFSRGGNDVILADGGFDKLLEYLGIPQQDYHLYTSSESIAKETIGYNSALVTRIRSEINAHKDDPEWLDGLSRALDTGNGGDDALFGGVGNDMVFGGSGNDYINSNGQANYGTALGNDKDMVFAGEGDDIIIYDANDFIIHGGDGIDFLLAGKDDRIDLNDLPDSGNHIVAGIEVLITALHTSDVTKLGITSLSNLANYGVRIENGETDAERNIVLSSDWTLQDDGSYLYNHNGVRLRLETVKENVVLEKFSYSGQTATGGIGNDVLMTGTDMATLASRTGLLAALGLSLNATSSEIADAVRANPEVAARWVDSNVSVGWANYEGGAGDDIILGTQANECMMGDDFSAKDTIRHVIQGEEPHASVLTDYKTLVEATEEKRVEIASRFESEVETSHDPATDGSDHIHGGGGTDVIYGNGGDDVLAGDGGDDVLIGGSGNDRILGGEGEDFLFGGSGNDYLEGGAGRDYLYGGTGNDVLVYDPNDAVTNGGEGIDLLLAGMNETKTLAEMLASPESGVSGIEILIRSLDTDDAGSLGITSLDTIADNNIGIEFRDDTLYLNEDWVKKDGFFAYSKNGKHFVLETTLEESLTENGYAFARPAGENNDPLGEGPEINFDLIPGNENGEGKTNRLPDSGIALQDDDAEVNLTRISGMADGDGENAENAGSPVQDVLNPLENNLDTVPVQEFSSMELDSAVSELNTAS